MFRMNSSSCICQIKHNLDLNFFRLKFTRKYSLRYRNFAVLPRFKINELKSKTRIRLKLKKKKTCIR